MELHFERGTEISREARQLPASLYNSLHILFKHSETECLFIPIRSMQYLAVIDKEEIIFVDGLGRREIELSWRDFLTENRQGIQDPVPYTCIYYQHQGPETMKRLQGDFGKAIELLEQRREKPQTASVTYI